MPRKPNDREFQELDGLIADTGATDGPEIDIPISAPPPAAAPQPDPARAERIAKAQEQAKALGETRNEAKVWVSEKTQECVCIRKCYHVLNPQHPETCRIFNVGDKYTARDGELVPRHFVARASGDPRIGTALAGATPDEKAPPFVQKARKVEMR